MKSIILRIFARTKKEIKGKISKMYPPPPPRFYRAAILGTLNGQTPGWIEVAGYHSLTAPKLYPPNSVDFNFPQMGMVLKVFLNVNTGEVRTYLAKWLDVPEQDRIILWAND